MKKYVLEVVTGDLHAKELITTLVDKKLSSGQESWHSVDFNDDYVREFEESLDDMCKELADNLFMTFIRWDGYLSFRDKIPVRKFLGITLLE
ncbi:MAG: hypothetical protein AABY22_30390 [Nanoarchaeota archaeon]